MSSQMEVELVRTLTGAADAAPIPTDDFVAAVQNRQRVRRRHQRLTAVTACAAVLAVAGGLTAVRRATVLPAAPVPAVWSGTAPDFGGAKSPERLWPQAVHRLPGTLPDGSRYGVRSVLDSNRYLVSTTGGRPAVFDVSAGTVRILSDPNAEDVQSGLRGEIAAAGDRAVWLANVTRGGQAVHEVWTARLDGEGGPRLLVTLTEQDAMLPHIGVVKDAVYWWRTAGNGSQSAGIYRLPLSGGTPEVVPGSAGFQWMGLSPWISTQGVGTPITAPRGGELWNVATGERRRWTANPTDHIVWCDPVLCWDVKSGGRYALQRLDGTGRLELPYENADFSMWPAVDGRFGVGNVTLGGVMSAFVWDRFTGKAAIMKVDLDPTTNEPTPTGGVSLGFEKSTVQWSDGKSGMYVLDLKAIT